MHDIKYGEAKNFILTFSKALETKSYIDKDIYNANANTYLCVKYKPKSFRTTQITIVCRESIQCLLDDNKHSLQKRNTLFEKLKTSIFAYDQLFIEAQNRCWLYYILKLLGFSISRPKSIENLIESVWSAEYSFRQEHLNEEQLKRLRKNAHQAKANGQANAKVPVPNPPLAKLNNGMNRPFV